MSGKKKRRMSGKGEEERSLTSITGTNPSVMTARPGNDLLLDQYFSQPILQQITSEILHQWPGEIACRTIAWCENTTSLIDKHRETGGQSGQPTRTGPNHRDVTHWVVRRPVLKPRDQLYGCPHGY